MIRKLGNALNAVVCAVLVFQLVGCGTILYPERRGQRAGHIDVGVALLDGIGLFFFLIPGIIAYAVDFSNGTIYLPGTSLSSVQLNNIQQVKFDPKHSSIADIERMIKEKTGHSVKFDQANMSITKLRSTRDMMIQFAQILPEIQDNRVAFIR